MRIALAQINPTVGDFEGNLKKIIEYTMRAAEYNADLVCFPEMSITGYPPEDLLLKPSFIKANLTCIEEFAAATRDLDITTALGFVDLQEGKIYNAAAIINKGNTVAVYRKIRLRDYGFFDEQRYFSSGNEVLIITCAGANIGITISDDLWLSPVFTAAEEKGTGAEVTINLSATPFHIGRQKLRERMLSGRAAENTCFLAYVNLVGGQDELIFDGNSMILDEEGNTVHQGKAFEEDLIIADLRAERAKRKRLYALKSKGAKALAEAEVKIRRVFVSGATSPGKRPIPRGQEPAKKSADLDEAQVYSALVLAVRDYVNKNNFPGVYIGLSGGIDSALTAAIAVDALGRDRVTGVFMPSPITSRESREDSELLATNLGIKLITVPIGEIAAAYITALQHLCGGKLEDLTIQNIQARIRGNILMALTNQFGGIVLTTGNKSELSTGYATLYGDMAGGFAVLKDIPKTFVYRLARYRNEKAGKHLIPARILEKAPTAELRPGQKDEDDLPPYKILDQIIEYVEQDYSAEEIIAEGLPKEDVLRTISMIYKSEYKRRQAPPGARITPDILSLKEGRLPITNKFRKD